MSGRIWRRIAALAKQLREVVFAEPVCIQPALFCLYVPTECMKDYHTLPEIYNDVTSQVLRNGEWQLAEHIRPGELIPVQIIFEVPAPSEGKRHETNTKKYMSSEAHGYLREAEACSLGPQRPGTHIRQTAAAN